MQQPNKMSEYLETVRQQIRWKRAQSVVTEELHAHLDDQIEDYLVKGLSEEEAENRAVAEMGDPVSVGQ